MPRLFALLIDLGIDIIKPKSCDCCTKTRAHIRTRPALPGVEASTARS